MIYFDNAATTAPLRSVCEAINNVNMNLYANASALHTFGFEAEKIVTRARKAMADFMKVRPENIIFTSGGTESNNIAVMGFLKANPRLGRHIITSAVEHPAVLEVFRNLASEGYRVTILDTDDTGEIDYEQLEDEICEDTALISIMNVNNEVGTIQDLEKVSHIRNRKNPKAAIHSDCVQAFGKIQVCPEKIGVDMLSLSGHKFYGPKGIGALYIRKGIKVLPIMYGGGHERGIRSGTLNTPAIAGLYEALKFAEDNIKVNYEKAAAVKRKLAGELKDRIPFIKINGVFENSSPYILNVSFPGVKSEVLLHHLAEKDIFVSSGSACSSNSKNRKYSHVLFAMGAGADEIDGAVRFSFSCENTEEEALNAARAIEEIIPRIKYK